MHSCMLPAFVPAFRFSNLHRFSNRFSHDFILAGLGSHLKTNSRRGEATYGASLDGNKAHRKARLAPPRRAMISLMIVHEARVRVRYAETDQMGVVYYANYLIWMEVGRVEWCKKAGFVYRDMEHEDGIYLAVVEAQCRYRHPARYDDEVVVKTWDAENSPRSIRFQYEMRRASDERLLAEGSTRHVFCNKEMRPTRLPAKYHALFGLAG